MAKLSLKTGTTSKLIDLFIQDSSKTDGSGLTGLVYNSAGMTAYYYREGAASSTAITLATMTLGTWTSGGFIVIDGTNMKGCYQLGIPDAAIAAGAKSVLVVIQGATNQAPCVLEIELTATDNQDGVRGGMTALPNANAEASGGLYTRGTGAGQINQDANGRIDANVKAAAGTAVTLDSNNVLNVSAKYLAGTALTARDIGASVIPDSPIKKNTALSNFEFVMHDSSGNPKTGLTVTAQRSIDGAGLAACANSVSEVSNGIYKINLAASDLNGTVITFSMSATGAVDTDWTVVTQATS